MQGLLQFDELSGYHEFRSNPREATQLLQTKLLGTGARADSAIYRRVMQLQNRPLAGFYVQSMKRSQLPGKNRQLEELTLRWP